jgi:transketolase
MNIKIAEKHDADSPAFRDVFCKTLEEIAEKDSRIVLLDADLMGSMGSKAFAKRFPGRTFNCGIAEANMAGVAAGLGLNGFTPFLHTFGGFASRRMHDQVFLSGAFARSNMKILGTDPGVTAAYNGATHMPFEEFALMRVIPGMTVIEFSDTAMLRDLLPKIAAAPGMFYMRMARKLSYTLYESGSSFEIGKAARLRSGGDAAVFAAGYCVREALLAADMLAGEGIQASVYDMFTVKPIDRDAVAAAARETGAVVTAENHNIIGGLGSAVAEVLGEECPVPLRRVGIRDHFGEVGSVEFLAEKFGIDAASIAAAVRQAVAAKKA